MTTSPATANSTSPGSQSGHDHASAIALMCVAVTIFAVLDSTAKYLAQIAEIPVLQVIWVRFFVHVIIMCAFFWPRGLSKVVVSRKPAHQVIRSILLAATTAFNFAAVKYLQLDQTVTIFFLAPLLVAALAGPILGEWVGWRRLLAILSGFLGVLLVTRPGFGGIHWAVIFSFCSTACYALYGIHTRYMTGHDSPEVNLFYTAAAGAALGAPFGLAVWVWPQDAFTWLLFAWLGICGMAGHWLLILAYKRAPAPVVTPFVYVGLISMIALGYVIFGDVPDIWTLTGGGIVIGSGLYLYYRERWLEQRET